MTNHQSKPNSITMHRLIIVTLLVGSVLCKPNQQQQQRTDYDSKLLRKALDETNLPRSAELVAASYANSTSAANFQCPEQFGYYTDTRDCTKYYVCVFGEVLHESCTGGLRFSRELQTCDWPRNVECPQSSSNGSTQATGAASSSPGPAQSSPYTTTAASSTSSGTILLKQPQQPSAKEPPSADSGGGGGGGGGGDEEEERSLKGSSMVFADEGSDPQQPSFDEAVSPVITSDGGIHLHDGTGGTYSLTPNHNRQDHQLDQVQPQAQQPQQQQQQSQQQHQHQGQNVNIFVKPLIHPQASAGGRPRANQQQVGRQTTSSKLQPATLPEPRAGSVGAGSGNSNQKQQQQQQQRAKPTNNLLHQNANQQQHQPQQRVPQTTTPSRNVNLHLSSKDDESGSDSEIGGAEDSLGAQDDQESGENLDSGLSEPDLGAGLRQQQAGGAYIPPVSAPNAQRQVGANRQSSQLLSVNNRQVDPKQSSFRPILISSVPVASQQQTQASNNNLQSQQNQRSHQPTASSQQQDSSPNSMNNEHDNPSDELADEQVDRAAINSISRQNSVRQNKTIATNLLSHQSQLALVSQNNRQSRMSNLQLQQQQQQQQQQTQQFTPSHSHQHHSNNHNQNHNTAGGRQQSRFQQADQVLSNNVNFNDSSKLIRLQASQFEPSPTESSAGSNNNEAGSGETFPKLPSPSSSRSHNVLFSQQPFGLLADTAANSGSASSSLDLSNGIVQNDPMASSGGGGKNFGPSDNFLYHNPNTPLIQQQRRPRPPKRQQIPSGSLHDRSNQASRVRGGADTVPTTTTTTTTLPTTSGFLSPHDAAFVDSDEPGPTPPSFPAAQTAALGQAPRPIVAPTTVNFQQESGLTSGFGTPTTYATSPSSLQVGSGGRRVSQRTEASRNLQNSAIGSQGQRSAQLVLAAPTEPPPLGSITTTSSLDPVSNNANVNLEQDPQLVANRYLNSAIDALEAGQPFGTVDYDFDILNDNSTDRRNPTTTTTTTTTTSAVLLSSNQSSFNANLNANRFRQQPTIDGQAEGDNIKLTNGQPNGGQTGLNMRPQQQQHQQASGGRNRAGSGQVNRQQQQQLAGGQFDQDSYLAAPNLPQQTTASSLSASGQQNSPTKRPRPTNKKITVNHEQAIANNRASTEPARRPEALFSTPTALQTATKCDNRLCRLPDCKCGDTLIPGGIEAKVIPQIVLLTFDDAVNDLNWEIYEELFSGRTNPNGCPILATFYVSHEWTDYGQVQTLYSRGHEMASHSITHSFGEKFSKSQWFKEVNGQREILNMYGGVKMNDVRGMRAPFLQIGGNKMFEMLYDANFTYDSSMPIFENSPPLWPYTLDYQLAHECMITPCPTKSFPGVWEVGMTMWVDLRGGRCSMGDACSNPPDEDGVYEMLMKNFNRHYKSNRAPFGLFYHSAWFNTVHHRRGFLRFMGTVNSLSDVFFVTNWQMLQWMRKPTPLSEINSFEPWQCPAKNDRPPPCFHPSVCNVKSEHGKFMN